MDSLIKRFGNLVKGCITGFDRIVFKGFLLPLMSEKGAMNFCRNTGILNKDYKKWMMKHTAEITRSASEYSMKNCGHGIIPIKTWRIRKEELARQRQEEEQIKNNLIGIWSCVESCLSYRAAYSAQKGFPQLKRHWTCCKHLYFYFDHKDFGFLNVRLQTWFPYHVQICLNGREWLRRQLEQDNIGFFSKGNKFFDIADYEKAQRLLDSQLDIRWADILNGFVSTVFPMKEKILGNYLSYHWSMWQSEWATDLIFNSPRDLAPIMDSLLCHAFMTGTSTRILRYLDRPLKSNGKPRLDSSDNVTSRMMDFNEGVRVRHWVDNNSVKVYNEQNVLRIEMTMNKPDKFRVHRHKQGQSVAEKKTRLPLRKGIVDIPLRAKVSQEVNNRFMKNLSFYKDETPVRELFGNVTFARIERGRRIRALDCTGKDRELLQAISDPAFQVAGFTNKMLRQALVGKSWAAGRTDKQLSARISRHLKLLREHGIIKKLPKQNRYRVTDKGEKLTNVLNAFWVSSTEKLMKLAA
jgi:DNA-binding transcriptional ArsR family regulator